MKTIPIFWDYNGQNFAYKNIIAGGFGDIWRDMPELSLEDRYFRFGRDAGFDDRVRIWQVA
jgi:hypothetical protein